MKESVIRKIMSRVLAEPIVSTALATLIASGITVGYYIVRDFVRWIKNRLLFVKSAYRKKICFVSKRNLELDLVLDLCIGIRKTKGQKKLVVSEMFLKMPSGFFEIWPDRLKEYYSLADVIPMRRITKQNDGQVSFAGIGPLNEVEIKTASTELFGIRETYKWIYKQLPTDQDIQEKILKKVEKLFDKAKKDLIISIQFAHKKRPVEFRLRMFDIMKRPEFTVLEQVIKKELLAEGELL